MLLRLHVPVVWAVRTSIASLACLLACSSASEHVDPAHEGSSRPPGSAQLPASETDAAIERKPEGDAGARPSRVASAESPISPGSPDAAAAGDAGAPGASMQRAPDAGAQQAPGPGATAPACAGDADCKPVDATCEVCRCLALPTGTDPPACKGQRVTCVVDPCEDKRAVCRDGVCALQDESPSTF